ncbi:MAG: phosphoribosylformylglycinamidine cyclo-ligase [Deltaproteobacteria bacterium]|nr:phosphoribosylformylglycinamidine cyclo-ligase [Deltaproteobacteria bacterium]
MDYRDAGVDRDAAYAFVDDLKTKVKKTKREEVLGELGDFGGFFSAPKHMKNPIWVAATDGVGTKLMLAEEAMKDFGPKFHHAMGQDAVAMCVNDLIACRAEPIIFLDYLATGKLNPEVLNFLLEGIVDACAESGCALIGGETAQMPGFYPGGRYDVAGFSVGVLEKEHRMSIDAAVPGDLIFGMESVGFHSNGFSLVRKVLADQNWKLTDSFEGSTLAEVLLKPTRLYVKPLLQIFSAVNIKAAAHITGGGLIDNLSRGVNESKVSLIVDPKTIPVPSVMRKFCEAAKLSLKESFSTWNMGIGFCFIISPEDEKKIPQIPGFKIHKIGQVEAKKSEAVILA